MTSKDSAQDQELLDRYRRASDTDEAAPSEAVRSAILAESRRVAEQLAAKGSPPPFDVSRPAANDSRWKITAFGTAGAALLAALLIAPRYWEGLPTPQESTVPVAAPTAAPAAAPEPKLESIAPSRRLESSQGMAALQEGVAPRDSKTSKPVQSYRPPQNYAPAPLALQPAPAAPPASATQADLASANNLARATQGGALMGADRAARAARERNAPEPLNLQSASAAGDLAQATSLLDQGAAVDARDTLGRTPLLIAVAQNRLAVVRLLLARGADPNAADDAGVTPLQLAKNKDLRDVAALLERAGAR